MLGQNTHVVHSVLYRKCYRRGRRACHDDGPFRSIYVNSWPGTILASYKLSLAARGRITSWCERARAAGVETCRAWASLIKQHTTSIVVFRYQWRRCVSRRCGSAVVVSASLVPFPDGVPLDRRGPLGDPESVSSRRLRFPTWQEQSAGLGRQRHSTRHSFLVQTCRILSQA